MSKDKPTPGGRAKKNTAISLVRSSAAEYLTFVAASGAGGVEAVYADENVWLSQRMMGQLYDVATHTINYHLKKVFADSELQEDSVIRNFRITAADGKSYDTQHYNLAAIIAVGYKVIRQWIGKSNVVDPPPQPPMVSNLFQHERILIHLELEMTSQ